MYQSQNPFTQVIAKKYRNITNDSLNRKIDLSVNAFKNWKTQSFQFRGNLMKKVADLLDEKKEFYGSLITLEMGKPITQSVAEVEKCAWVCRYYAENALDFLKTQRMNSTASMSQVNFEPLGTILAVMPWNFPFWQVFRFLAPTLMAGNTGLLKHASNVPQCAEAIELLLSEAGVPKGVFQNLFISYDQVEQVIASRHVKAVTFTGSNYAGSKIAELSGKYTKKSVLELGGSDPFIVFDDADLNLALEQAVLAKFLNTGQSCIAAKRFIIHHDIADEFIDNLQSLTENLVMGNPMDEESFIGPMVNSRALKELHTQVTQSIKSGAVCITGGDVNSEMSSIYQPTILVDVPSEAAVWNQEVFGPVVSIRIFNSDEEAIQMANDTIFGLGASVWTQDMDRAAWACKNINAGTVIVNGMVKSEPGLPFGGINESGYGRELSSFGILEFMNIKTISYSA